MKILKPYSKSKFESLLRGKEVNYHIHHPFHIAMNSGQCTKKQIQGWVVNRYYYQISIPIKDSAILSNMDSVEDRKLWIQRVLDHDGFDKDKGGIEAWLVLGEACGLSRKYIKSLKGVIPGVKFAIDAYINFARTSPWQESVCSSLTELFAPKIHKKRLDNWPEYYPWIDKKGYQYFRKRLSEARRDVEHGLRVTLKFFKTREEQEKAINILQFKLNVLWTMLDAMQVTYGIGDDKSKTIARMVD
jgi:pyrroloquinoline-quinone synthase